MEYIARAPGEKEKALYSITPIRCFLANINTVNEQKVDILIFLWRNSSCVTALCGHNAAASFLLLHET